MAICSMLYNERWAEHLKNTVLFFTGIYHQLPLHALKEFARAIMSVKNREVRRQVVTDIKAKNSVWKKQLCDTFQELHLVPENFTGKLVISFKEGGISFVEKTETFK